MSDTRAQASCPQPTPPHRPRASGLTRAARADLLTAGITFVIVVAFWAQRDYRGRLSGVFPDFVLIALALFATYLVLRVLVGRLRAGARDGTAGQAGGGGEQPVPARAATVLLAMLFPAVWVALLAVFGFVPSGIVAFVATTLFARRRDARPRHLLVDVPIAAALVGACYFVFTYVMFVPLPLGLFGV